MAVSGSYNYSMNARQVCYAALRKIGNFGIAYPIDTGDVAITLEALNVLIKSTFKDGIWLNQEVMLFLAASTQMYQLGSDRAVAAADVTDTALSEDHVETDTTMEVDSTAGMTAGDVAGVVLDDNTIHWDTIASVTDSDTFELTNGLSGDDASEDNRVYTYTSGIYRPTAITEARLRDNNDRDIPLSIVGRNDYMGLPQKDSTGLTNQVYFDMQRQYAELRVWPLCADLRYRIMMTVKRYVQDFDSRQNDLDFPIEWARPLIFMLADDIKMEFGTDEQTSAEIREKAIEAEASVAMFDRDEGDIEFEFDQMSR